MPLGKPAGIRCVQLSSENLCLLYLDPSRPAVCDSLRADVEICGSTREEALVLLSTLEAATRTN
jgi:hypothetical protein